MIKILFLIDSLGGGGMQRRMSELVRAIHNSNKFEIELIAFKKNMDYKNNLEIGFHIHYIPRSDNFDVSVFFKIYRICKDFKPDLIHSWDAISTFYIIPSKLLLGIKLINSQIADAPANVPRFSANYILKEINFRFSNLIISNSNAGLKSYKAPGNRSMHIHNGFNYKRLENIKDKDQVTKSLGINTTHVIGMIAHYSRFKDYTTFINAAKKILEIRNDITFICAGKDLGAKKEYADLIQSDSQKNHIKLLDRQSEIESIINVFTIGVLCTKNEVHSEGISNSILEYMAMGKPVIASSGGGTSEILVDGKTGFILPSNDHNILADKILFLLDNPKISSEMGVNSRKRILDKFNLEKKSQEYMEVYRNLYKNPS
jgi:glycosyltransferase involved in cell wall biosynthesis